MRKIWFVMMLVVAIGAAAKVDFDKYFDGRGLRVDYCFAGDSVKQEIFVSEYVSLPKWCGRRVNMDTLLLEGTGDVVMRSLADGKKIYCNSFSTHFQDWTGTPQALTLKCAYEHVVLMPMPREKVEIEIRLFDFKQRPVTVFKHEFDPKDIMVRSLASVKGPETKKLVASGSPEECIDLAIVAEGYTKEELPMFYQDAQRMVDELFKYEPFKSNKHRFNVVAVGAESAESGVSEPAKGIWKDTACKTFFDFLYMKRLIGVVNLRRVNDLLAAVPYEHVVVLANSSEYGGCGVYNSYDITPAHHAGTLAVFVHEFGHSFGGLGDEYFYDEMYTQYYYPDVEPWHENLTTLCDFQRKWADMLPKGAKIPTPVTADQDKNDCTTVGVFEGGGNQSKGVYRPAFNCRMRTNTVPDYCPVCRRALQHVIDYHLVER